MSDGSDTSGDLAGLTAAHRAVVEDLLGWDGPRPTFDHDLVADLEQKLATGLGPLARDSDQRLWLSKSALRALDCDGRWLDRRAGTFTPSVALLAGTLTHRAAELDTASGRRFPVDDLVARAMQELGSRQASKEADLLNALDPVERADLEATCRDGAVEWRLLWPMLDGVEASFEHRLRAQFGRGAVVVSGQPDLVVRSPRPRAGRATDLVIDLKTGRRNETGDRADLRLYALLWTLKYRRPPFRWATFYLAEGRWAKEDFDPSLLHGAADRLVDGAARAARLEAGVAEEHLELNPGGHCSFCGRRPTCPVAPAVV